MTSIISRGIGLLGGTFDPVHTGHLALAREALRALHLARVDFLPAPAPWQKNVLTPIDQRLALLEAALEGHPEFGINLCDVLRDGPTYTIDTVRELRRDVGGSMPLVLLIGADQWSNLHTWRDWEKLTDFASIAICDRGGETAAPRPEVARWAQSRWCDARELTQTPSGRLSRFDMPEHDASSTKIRRLFAELGRSEALRRLALWLPTPTAALIARRRLY